MVGSAKALEYQAWKPRLMEAVLDSFARVKAESDIVLVEGAGSASEVNLRANDIANMGFARAADVPVILVGDIDRGGVIAQIVGTKAVIAAEDAAMVAGFIVNKFRGDPTLFDDGMRLMENAYGLAGSWPRALVRDAGKLPAEDAVVLGRRQAAEGAITIAVPHLPHISNFDDLDPLRAEPDCASSSSGAANPFPPTPRW